jgi:energy-coupling factor transporter ATP-binding protein EcfA2
VALLVQLKRQLSLLIISHDLRELAPIIDTAWEMHPGGRLECMGTDIPVSNISTNKVDII